MYRLERCLGRRRRRRRGKVMNEVVTEMDLEPKVSRRGFYESVRFMLLVGRLMGLLPISGLAQRNSDLTRYTLKTPYVLAYIPSLATHVFTVAVFAFDNITSKFQLTKLAGLFYRIMSLISILLLIPFSRNWNTMIKKLESIETTLPYIKNPVFAIQSSNGLMAVVFIYAFVEYFVYMQYTIGMTRHCFLLPGDSGLYVKSYFLSVYGWLYKYIPFDYSTTVFVNISKLQYAFMWTFTDVLIIVFCLHLVFKFNDFNRLMAQNQIEISVTGTSRLPWPELQVYFTRLTRLAEITDKSINSFVLLSFTTNLCFIGQQMYFILNNLYRNNFMKSSDCLTAHSSDLETTLYQLVSLTLLFGRTILVAALAARLNSLSRRPLEALHTVPASAYDYDLQRFMDQVYHSNICVSGLGFFHVTRGMILSVLATLMTYELVVLQF